jgi:hypothetical protein
MLNQPKLKISIFFLYNQNYSMVDFIFAFKKKKKRREEKRKNFVYPILVSTTVRKKYQKNRNLVLLSKLFYNVDCQSFNYFQAENTI